MWSSLQQSGLHSHTLTTYLLLIHSHSFAITPTFSHLLASLQHTHTLATTPTFSIHNHHSHTVSDWLPLPQLGHHSHTLSCWSSLPHSFNLTITSTLSHLGQHSHTVTAFPSLPRWYTLTVTPTPSQLRSHSMPVTPTYSVWSVEGIWPVTAKYYVCPAFPHQKFSISPTSSSGFPSTKIHSFLTTKLQDYFSKSCFFFSNILYSLPLG